MLTQTQLGHGEARKIYRTALGYYNLNYTELGYGK
jgi:hypothetical protein